MWFGANHETLEINSSFGEIIFHLPTNEKKLIRKLEKLIYKKNAAETAITFNNVCIQEGLLPNYSSLRLHDPSASDELQTQAFRRRLVERQLQNKEAEKSNISRQIQEIRQEFY